MPELPSEPNIDIARRILIFRGERVLLDLDLAQLYGVTIKRLNQQVRRNLDKFPGDFLFQLEPGEADSLRMHFATLKKTRGGHRKHAPPAGDSRAFCRCIGSDTRKQFDQVYEAILGLMGSGPRKN